MARKRFRKICVICGKTFVTTFEKRVTCKKECKLILREQRRKENCKEQLCWDCVKATGGCSWSRNLKPVDGWIAKQVKRKDGETTYKITSCPQFIHD